MNFNAVERVVEFMELEEEAPTITDKRPPKEVIIIYYFSRLICSKWLFFYIVAIERRY
jgi:hypothetical protein